MGKTYTNEINSTEVSLAIEHLLVGDTTATAPTGRIDIDSPPTGFRHLGAVVEDSPVVNISREKYQLATGIPRVLQFDAVQGLSGQFGISFYSNSNRVVRYALGGATPRNTLVNTTSITTPVATRTQVEVEADMSASWAVGDLIVTDTTTLITSDNEAEISSISTTTVYFKSPGFHTAPTTGDLMGEVTRIDLAFGTTSLPKYFLVGVADFLDGVQIQHHFPKVTPVGEFSENINPNQAGVISANWDIYATKAGAEWDSEFILGERIYVPSYVS